MHACTHRTQLRVELSRAQDLCLRIYDNGKGIDRTAHRGKLGHFGLQSMRERAARIRDKVSAETPPAPYGNHPYGSGRDRLSQGAYLAALKPVR